MYTQPATTLTPALIIYLIDASHSMNDACDPTTKIGVVNKALKDAIKDMIRWSVRERRIRSTVPCRMSGRLAANAGSRSEESGQNLQRSAIPPCPMGASGSSRTCASQHSF